MDGLYGASTKESTVEESGPPDARRARGAHLLLLALLIGAIPASGSPVTVRSISFTGNDYFTPRQLTELMSVRAGAVYSAPRLTADLDAVEEAYRAQGFLNARLRIADTVFSSNGGQVDIAVSVKEGRRSIVGSIHLRGESLLSREGTEGFSVHPGDPLSPPVLERDLDDLLREYEKLAHPYARCSIESLTARPGTEVDTIDIGIVVDEGPRVTIGELRVEGNKETNADVILRETRIAAGDPYDPVRVEAVRRRLLKLNIFSSVEEPELYSHGQRNGLLIRVQEGSTNTFDGVLGYIPSAAGQSGYVTGLASVSMRNLFGTGRKLQLRWQREDQRSEEIQAQYMEPWVFGLPFNVGGGFFQRQQDSSYVQRNLDARFEAMPSDNITAGLTLNSQRVIPSFDSTYQSPIPASSTFSFGADLAFDTRSDPINPLSGALYRIAYSFGRKHATASVITGLGGGTSTIQRLQLDLEVYFQLIRRQVLAFGLHGHDVRGGNVSESDMFRFGGATTLRGYRENQFLGSKIAWTNTEYRFVLDRRSFFFLFFDTGYYARPADEIRALPSAEAFKYGYGVGVRVDTPLGNIGVSFALGQGDTFSTAKIHVNIINEF
ncbi:MAG: POTRA domain-containing protein [Bacteroidota bacterium]